MKTTLFLHFYFYIYLTAKQVMQLGFLETGIGCGPNSLDLYPSIQEGLLKCQVKRTVEGMKEF